MSLECRKCKSIISTKEIIDGKKRNLQRRKYCLVCSPFGGHNTKKDIETESLLNKTSFCNSCNKEFLYRHKGDRINKCNSCVTKEARKALKKKCLEFKGNKCEKCGYSKCMEALEFHHLDPTQKEFEISGSNSKNWNKIVNELKKCLLVCSNCHREIHSNLY